MSLKLRSRRPVGKQSPPAPRRSKPLALPVDRDESTQATAHAPDPVIEQAGRDLAAGQVDTDMHATPGLDAGRRAQLVPGPGGKPPPTGAP